MKDKKFDFAVITSCGNVVKAKPVPVPPHHQKPPKEVVPVVKKAVIVKPAPKQIVNAGPSSVVAFGSIATVAGTVGYQLYKRRFN